MRITRLPIPAKLVARVFGAPIYWWIGAQHDRTVLSVVALRRSARVMSHISNYGLIRDSGVTTDWRKRHV